MAASSSLNAQVGKPYLLAFFFSPNLPLVVTAEVQRLEDGSKHNLDLPKCASLCNTENWVYTAYCTPTALGWHVIQYRAKTPEGELVVSNLSRFLVESEAEGQTQVIRSVVEGKMTTAFTTTLMNKRGILSFKTRTK